MQRRVAWGRVRKRKKKQKKTKKMPSRRRDQECGGMAEVEARASRRARLELEEFERGGLVWERGGRAANLKASENQRRGEKEAKEETKINGKEAKTKPEEEEEKENEKVWRGAALKKPTAVRATRCDGMRQGLTADALGRKVGVSKYNRVSECVCECGRDGVCVWSCAHAWVALCCVRRGVWSLFVLRCVALVGVVREELIWGTMCRALT